MRTKLTSRRLLTKGGLAACAVVALTGLLAACGSSGGSGGSGSSGGSGADFAFFKGKTITYYVNDPVGGSWGLEAPALKIALAQKLDARVDLVYSGASGNVPGQNIVAAANPDGLTIGNQDVQSDLANLYSGVSTLTHSLTDESFIGGSHVSQQLVVACKGAPYTSFSQLSSAGKQLSVLSIPNTGNSLAAHLVLAAFPVSHKYLYGYSSGADQSEGCERGDGDLSVAGVDTQLAASGTAMAAGVTPLLLMASEPAGAPPAFLNSKVPTFASYATAHPPTTQSSKDAVTIANELFGPTAPEFVTFGPKGIPANRLLALQEAFSYALSTPAVKKVELEYGLTPGVVPASQVQSFVNFGLSKKAQVAAYMKD